MRATPAQEGGAISRGACHIKSEAGETHSQAVAFPLRNLMRSGGVSECNRGRSMRERQPHLDEQFDLPLHGCRSAQPELVEGRDVEDEGLDQGGRGRGGDGTFEGRDRHVWVAVVKLTKRSSAQEFGCVTDIDARQAPLSNPAVCFAGRPPGQSRPPPNLPGLDSRALERPPSRSR
jgi:hypothetical protein